ncbi:MAG TPA: hypothetical protein VD967_00680, partial [Candidatus Paceibacterota bacterium]|nr:hypothetical protein [Candidatus Paceibacterota bacterium]
MSSAQISTVYQTIGHATRIDQLANTTISTPTVSGGSWSGASLTGATSIAALTLSTATTTAENGFNITAGCFAVNGTCIGSGSGSGTVGSGTQGYFPFYNGSGTTLTATSSIYLTQGGNIGIGTTSPSTQLGVQGSILVSGTTTTGALTATGTVTFSSGLAATSGGTGQTTFTTGDILYASGANTLAKLAVGSNGQVLKLAGGVPTWAADNTGGGGGGSGFFSTTTNDMIIYPADTADILVLGSNATTTTGNIFETVGNVKIGGQLLVTSSTSLQNFTGANATVTNATTTSIFSDVASSTRLFTSNFTLGRVSGFLKATAGAVATALIDLAADVTGILPVSNGGTGVATLPAGSFLVGNGTSAVTSTSSPTVAYVVATSSTATSTFAGAVGVGTTTPANTFALTGSAYITGGLGIGVANPGSYGLSISGKSVSVLGGIIQVQGGSAGSPSYAFTSDGNSGMFLPSASTLAFSTNSTERARFDSSGLFGIGTTSPWAKLAVNPAAGDTNQFVVGSSTATSFLITNAGNLRVGVTNGSNRSENNTFSGFSGFGDPNQSSPFVIVGNTGAGVGVLGSASNHDLQVRTNNTEVARFTTGGTLGIGTTTPVSTSQLTLTGTDAQLTFTRGAGSATGYIGTAGAFGSASTDDLRLRSDGSNILFGFSGTETVRFTSGGRAGFGTTSPFAKLSVHANNGDTNTRLFEIASSTASATSSLFTVLNNGNVGIGAATPNTGLDVRRAGSNNVYIAYGPTSDGSITNQQRLESDGSGGSMRISSPAAVFLNAGNNKFSFSQSTTCEVGSVNCFTSTSAGVGTTSPMAKLSVHANNGDTATSLFNVASSTASATTSLFNISNTGVITSNASATSTFAAGIQTTALNVTGATSTFANGIQIAAGCYRMPDGTCAGAGGSSLTGTQGQIAYFSGTDTAVGTSQLFLSTGNLFGIGSTTPFAKLSVNPVAGDTNQFVVGSSTRTSLLINNAGMVGIATTSPFARFAINPLAGDANQFLVGSSTTSFIINPAGKVGIGLTAPATRLDIFEANAAAQLRLTKSASLYSELTVDSTGDLTVSAAGGDIYSLTENLWVCDGGSCPALTATSTAGNVFVENAVTFGNGFSFRQISVNELGLYNASSSLLMIFDQGN